MRFLSLLLLLGVVGCFTGCYSNRYRGSVHPGTRPDMQQQAYPADMYGDTMAGQPLEGIERDPLHESPQFEIGHEMQTAPQGTGRTIIEERAVHRQAHERQTTEIAAEQQIKDKAAVERDKERQRAVRAAEQQAAQKARAQAEKEQERAAEAGRAQAARDLAAQQAKQHRKQERTERRSVTREGTVIRGY